MSGLTVTLIQASLAWEDTPANLRHLGALIDKITEPTEVVVLPEMFATGFSMSPEKCAQPMTGAAVNWMRETAAKKKIILTGSLAMEENGQFYNRLVWMLPNGTAGIYDKKHLFHYAGEGEHYSPGNKRLIASVNGWKVNLLVCYDLRFPVWSRNSLGKGGRPLYDLLVYVANWPERRIQAWKTLLQARAIENQCYVVGVNRVGEDGLGFYYSGDSMVIDPMGNILYQKSREEDVHTIHLEAAHLETVREKLPFLRDADPFQIVNA